MPAYCSRIHNKVYPSLSIVCVESVDPGEIYSPSLSLLLIPGGEINKVYPSSPVQIQEEGLTPSPLGCTPPPSGPRSHTDCSRTLVFQEVIAQGQMLLLLNSALQSVLINDFFMRMTFCWSLCEMNYAEVCLNGQTRRLTTPQCLGTGTCPGWTI